MRGMTGVAFVAAIVWAVLGQSVESCIFAATSIVLFALARIEAQQ